ncbi:hypothetical protein PAXINDRAFT_101213 [Paxillus involutus ATCC 200175]|uniref:Uncharacterized protein n=1 Tax=Paxillus involutus ATCC 200175 TaxID=664439 RepID=A0A0C9STX2_PAXIN|nr:hypothetical protein PAXINDRAFT_101213 [Paxillus involutus ATCC 200175]
MPLRPLVIISIQQHPGGGQVRAMHSSQVLFTANCFKVSMAALFILDYFYKLEDEACLTSIYTRDPAADQDDVRRYIHFILIPPTLLSSFAANPDVHTCETLQYIIVVLGMVAITLSEVTFGLRAKAALTLLAILLTFAAQAYVAALVFILRSFIRSVTFGKYLLGVNSGCHRTGGSSVVFAIPVVIMFTEAVTTALTLYRAYWHFRHTPNALVQNVTRDGVFYCMSMFSMSVANLLLICLVPIQYSDMMAVYQSVMHTILATRMQLHLRKVDQHTYIVRPFAEESLAPMSFTMSTFLADI